jgi:putative thioredoxin
MEININDNNFEKEVVEKSKQTPVVVDFWSQMCPPCLIIKPILEKLAKEYEGKFILAKANVDQARQKAQNYMVSSIPSVKMFKNGDIIDEFIGALPEEQIKGWLDKNLED